MKTSLLTKLFLAVVLGISTLALAEETKDRWFDYENCAFCKQWAIEPEVIDHAHDHVYPISDGIIWVTDVDSGYGQQFDRVMAEEEKISNQLKSGAQLPVCRFCLGIGQLADKGVRIEGVRSRNSLITLYTSPDTSLVKEIQSFANQAITVLPAANDKFRAMHRPTK